LISVIHLRQLEAAKKLGERKHWSDKNEEKAEEEMRELTEEERLLRVKAYNASDVL
jgi:hypothetical protein